MDLEMRCVICFLLLFQVVLSVGQTTECKNSRIGQEYAGTVAVTLSGIRCQRWDTQTPHQHTMKLENFPDNSFQEAENYCRNPDKHGDGPWCYTTNPDVRWERCNVQFCECKTNWIGKNYGGRVNRTRNNIPCQRWDSQTPHRHGRNDARNFPDRTLEEAANSCRNPDNEPEGPWCYTTDRNVRWRYCNVPPCDCKEDNRGKSFQGTRSRTSSGKTCQRWDSQTPHEHERTYPEDFPDKTLNDAANKCRNPDGKSQGPWCFTTDPNTRWEYCGLPNCFFAKRPRTTVPPPTPTPAPGTKGRATECKSTVHGKEYNGRVSQTRSGRTCQRWDSQSPHRHNRNEVAMFPDRTVADAANFCRNPDAEPEGPWCYTMDPDVRWEYCGQNIPKCDCKDTPLGGEYAGKVNRTSAASGSILCQRWDSNTPHQHNQKDPSKFPDATLADAANFCRHPDGDSVGPWCYTTDPNVRWRYCDIPRCDCKITPRGHEYAGIRNHTVNKNACQRWDSQSPHNHPHVQDQQFPDGSVTAAGNKCRNPDRDGGGPWCYTLNPQVRWEYCNVPYCQSITPPTPTPDPTGSTLSPAERLSECKSTTMGTEYNGRTSRTVSGRICQRWDSQEPHAHEDTDPEKFPDRTLGDASNYCRNPRFLARGPWCFTVDSSVRWEYCDIGFCDCKLQEDGANYMGKLSMTQSGKTCQAWTSQTPHKHRAYHPEDFPDVTVQDAANYCRNPVSDREPGGPWCYTTDPNTAWEYCNILMCECKKSQFGKEYTGRTSITRNGRKCQRWDSQTPHGHSRYDPSMFPDKSLGEASNFCRNPDNEPEGPWCYTTDPSVRWEYCDLPFCPGYSASSVPPTDRNPPNPLPIKGNNGGRVAGIVLGTLAAIILVTVAVGAIFWWRRKQQQKGDPPVLSTNVDPGFNNPGYDDAIRAGKGSSEA